MAPPSPHVVASQHAPPPEKSRMIWSPTPGITKNEYGAPRAHVVSPPVGMTCNVPGISEASVGPNGGGPASRGESCVGDGSGAPAGLLARGAGAGGAGPGELVATVPLGKVLLASPPLP